MIKLFYYDDESQNLLSESDAEETTLDEAIDEAFNLADDDKSFVGFITENNTIKIKSDDYDSYKTYLFDVNKDEYILNLLVDFEKCKAYITDLFTLIETNLEKVPLKQNAWLPPDWNKN